MDGRHDGGLALKASDDAPRKPSGRKVGYMELMHSIWNRKGYKHFGLSPQNHNIR